jgi:hypothetical protein
MARQALGCFEEQSDGRWICVHSIAVIGPFNSVQVQQGQSFADGTVFAGYDDFTAYLASVSIEMPMLSRHEWSDLKMPRSDLELEDIKRIKARRAA